MMPLLRTPMIHTPMSLVGSSSSLMIPRGPGALAPPPQGRGVARPVATPVRHVRINPAYHTILRAQQQWARDPRDQYPAGLDMESAMELAVQRQMQEAPPMRVQQPPWQKQPASGKSFTNTDNTVSATTITLPAVGAFGTVVSFQVPPGCNGVIDSIGNQIAVGGFQDGSGAILWYLSYDGMIYKGFNGIKQSIGTMSNPGDYSDKKIRIFENQIWQLLIFNVGLFAGTGIIQGLLAGYTYPISEEFQNPYV